MLTLTRRGVLVSEPVGLNRVISDYVKGPELEKLISLHPDVRIETDLSKTKLNILGSPVHLMKTVMNLISNAAEAMSHGGKILISTKLQKTDHPIKGYEVVPEGKYAVLTVTDTGVGISTEDMQRIFEPFYTKKVMGRSGTGLGMAVVRGCIKDHKGFIDIKSTEGEGTEFILYFPVTEKMPAKDKKRLSIEEYMGNGESILIVDDMEEQQEILSSLLTRMGYTATAVSSGKAAIAFMKENTADLVVLDIMMDPHIDGLETYEKILELHPGQKAVITSGFLETKRVKKAQELGAGQYVSKPYVLEKIGLAIKAELEK
jgi:CheY-like chemotaxis protein